MAIREGRLLAIAEELPEQPAQRAWGEMMIDYVRDHHDALARLPEGLPQVRVEATRQQLILATHGLEFSRAHDQARMLSKVRIGDLLHWRPRTPWDLPHGPPHQGPGLAGNHVVPAGHADVRIRLQDSDSLAERPRIRQGGIVVQGQEAFASGECRANVDGSPL